MESLENNENKILDQEDDGKTFAGGALFGDDVESDELESDLAEEPKVENLKAEEPKVEKVKEEKPKKAVKKEEPKPEEVKEIALHAEANLFKFGLGELKKGYNIVDKEAAEFWLKHRKVRIATPRELARYYGKE
jgi:hypothetical protein